MHTGIEIAFEVLIQATGTAGYESSSEDGVKQQERSQAIPRGHVITHKRGDEHHGCDARLGELEKIGETHTTAGAALHDRRLRSAHRAPLKFAGTFTTTIP